MSRTRRWLWATLNALAFLGALVANGLANALPINSMTTGELSDLYPNLFVPMGATFSIWGLIYAWLLAFVGYGLVLARSPRARTPLADIGPWFVVNALGNAAWIVAWHHTLVPVSVVLMGVIFGSLLAMYLRLGVGRGAPTAADRWLVHAPVSLYLGWISVATVANLTTLAVDLGAPAFGAGPAGITVAVLAVVVSLGLAMLWARRDWIFALVVAWALLGIHLKRAAATDPGSGLVAPAALVGLAAIGVGLLVAAARALRGGGDRPQPDAR